MTKEDDRRVELELVRRIRAGDREARAIYADWLEERGHFDRAMLLRADRSASAIVDLFSWLHSLGELGELGLTEIAPGCVAFGMSSEIPIAPGTGASIVMTPQVCPIRPTHLVVPESIAGNFLIADIRVGYRSQLQAPGPLPASVFTPSAIAGHGCRISVDRVLMAQDFALEIRNASDADCVFFAVVFCQADDAFSPSRSWPGGAHVRRAAGTAGRSLSHGMSARGELSPDEVSRVIDRVRSAVESARAEATAGRADAYPSSTDPIIDEPKP